MAEEVKQSRKGKLPVAIPKGVKVQISGQSVSFTGPKGTLAHDFHEAVQVLQEGETVVVRPREGSGKSGRQFQGLTRALVRNALHGVAEGYKTSLDLYGVGYRAELAGQGLTLSLGLSHQVKFELPESMSGRVETIDEAGVKRPRLHLESHDKTELGRVAARIRSFRPPEPYKGKGVRFTGERVREKAGKAGAKV